MKTHRFLIAITALLLTGVPSQSSAADVSVDIVSIAPRNPDAVIAQIELNVLLTRKGARKGTGQECQVVPLE